MFGHKEAYAIEKEEVLQRLSEPSNVVLQGVRPSEHDEFITSKSQEDYEKHFSSAPMTWEELQREVKGKSVRFIRRFVIVQSTGKKRCCDDAAEGGHTEVTQDANKLRFCSALQPATHVKLLHEAAAEEGRQVSEVQDEL